MYATVAHNESAERLNKLSPADKNEGLIWIFYGSSLPPLYATVNAATHSNADHAHRIQLINNESWATRSLWQALIMATTFASMPCEFVWKKKNVIKTAFYLPAPITPAALPAGTRVFYRDSDGCRHSSLVIQSVLMRTVEAIHFFPSHVN